jgi:antitoxin (DNA-binding transcriptional repressor) of toxin-antitoxin stability system
MSVRDLGPEPVVGVRELRRQLSAVLRLVANGRTVTIANRRHPVARLSPANQTREQEALDRLAGSRTIRRSKGKPGASRPLKPRRRLRRATSELAREDRR